MIKFIGLTEQAQLLAACVVNYEDTDEAITTLAWGLTCMDLGFDAPGLISPAATCHGKDFGIWEPIAYGAHAEAALAQAEAARAELGEVTQKIEEDLAEALEDAEDQAAYDAAHKIANEAMRNVPQWTVEDIENCSYDAVCKMHSEHVHALRDRLIVEEEVAA